VAPNLSSLLLHELFTSATPAAWDYDIVGSPITGAYNTLVTDAEIGPWLASHDASNPVSNTNGSAHTALDNIVEGEIEADVNSIVNQPY
jgi:hypothetical protein